MAGRLKDRLSLPVLAFAVFVVVVFSTTAFGLVAGDPFGLITGDPSDSTASPAPTIQSDKADYSPGETATLTGSNWQPGETVHINVDDDEGQTWSRDVDVTADQSGNITYQFRLPDWFVALYTVRATGSSGEVATTTIIDANLKVNGSFAGSTTDGYTLTYTRFHNAGCDGAARNDDPQTQNNISAGTFTVPPAGQNSATLTAAAISAQGRTFLTWTDSDGNDVPGVALNGRTICADFPLGDADKTYTAHYGVKANDDPYSTAKDNALNVPAPGVLGNDGGPNLSVKDSNSSVSGVQPESQPNNGTLTINANGSFTYTPNENFFGTDTFTYKATNGSADGNIATVTITVNAVNGAPVPAIQPPVSTNEDTAKVITLSASDVDGNNLTFAIVANSGPNHGTLGPIGPVTCQGTVCSANVAYTPNANYDGPDSFAFKANDGTDDSAPAPVSITVTPVDDAPAAVADSFSTDANTNLSVPAPGVLGNDTDVNRDALTAELVAGPSHGTLTLNPNGSFTYNPALNYSGPDSFTYKAKDASAGSNTVMVSITVRAVNDAPAAVNDSATTPEDNAVTIDVVANDTDTDGDSLSVVAASLSNPAHGTAAVVNGKVSYTPADNYHGSDSFTYDVSDGNGGTDTATVNVTGTPVNDAPAADAQSVTTDEDIAKEITLTGNDVDGDSLTYGIVDGPQHGQLSGSGATRTYTLDADYNGSDSFTFKANDGTADSNTATVSITVNPVDDAPVAKDDEGTTDEDTALSINVLSNDEDVDGDSLSVSGFDTTSAEGGAVSLDNGKLKYEPADDFNGTDSFTYEASDATAESNVATVSITVDAVNDAPVADDDSLTTVEDTEGTGNVLANDEDVVGDSLMAVVVAGPAHGTLTLDADGSFSYTPNENFFGTDSFTYKANDGNLDSNITTVSITVNAVNDAPVADNDSYTTDDTKLTVSAADGLLKNDADVEHAALHVDDANPNTPEIDPASGPSNGTLTLNADGSFEYMPDANYSGSDSFDYKVCDNGSPEPKCSVESAKVNIAINPVNDAPVAVDDANNTTGEDTPLIVSAPGVLGNDTDVENDGLTAVKVSDPAHGQLMLNNDGSFTYTPEDDYHEPDSFTYKANDGDLDSNIATVTIDVEAVNDEPVAKDDTATTPEDTSLTILAADLLANDSAGPPNESGQTLTITEVSNFQHGQAVLNANGSVTFTPDANYNGLDASFDYRVCDDGSPEPKCSVETAKVNVPANAGNDAPVAVADSFSTDEDETLTVAAPGVLSNDTDVENDSLTAAQASGPAHGHLTLNADGSFSYTPDPNYHGPDSFTYKANDGKPDSETPATVSITVNAVNDAPVADDQSVTTDEDTPKAITLGGSDGDGDSLTYSVVAGPQHGQLGSSGADLTYTPAPNYDGPDSFTFKANDSTAGSNVATVSITVNAVNDAPVVTNLQGAANEGETKAYTFQITDGDSNAFSFASGSPNCGATNEGEVVSGTAQISGNNGSFECRFLDGGATPTQVSVSAQVSDGQATSAPASKNVAVSNVAPKIESLSGPLQVLTNQLVTFTGTHSDPAGLLDNLLTWQWSGGTSTDTDKDNSFVTKFASCEPQSVSATVTDKDGGTSAAATLSNPVQVYNGNFLPPLQTGKDNMVQKGQVVPVKISVAGCDGISLAGLNPEIRLAKGDPTAGINEPDYTVPTTVSAADTSGFMRPVTDGYIYNLRIPSDTTVKANELYTIRVSPFGIASGQHMVIGVQIRK